MGFNVKAVFVIIGGSVLLAGLYLYLSYTRCTEDCQKAGLSAEQAAVACKLRSFFS